MKRLLLLFFICAFWFLACQPTPCEEAVQSQKEDYLAHVQTIPDTPQPDVPETDASPSAEPTAASERIELVSEQVQQVEIPKTLQTEPIPVTKSLFVQFDCTVQTSSDRFGIAQTEQRIFSKAELFSYLDQLLPEGTRYSTVGTTKAYFAGVVQSYIHACRNAGKEPEEAYIDDLSRQAQQASSEPEEARFDPMNVAEFTLTRVYAQNADGSYRSFLCKPGTASLRYCLDESAWLLHEDELEPEYDEEFRAYQQDFAQDFPDPDALLPKAQDALALFGLSDMLCTTQRKLLVYKGSVPVTTGWTFVFVHGVDGIPQRYASEAVESGFGVPTLVSPFGAEAAMLSIGSDGSLWCADLMNILKTPETVLGNVLLCDFPTLQQSIATHLKNRFSWPAQDNLPGSCATVDSMELCMALVNVKDHYDLGRLIPAWYVSGRYIGSTSGGVNSIGETVPGYDFAEPFGYYFSALDGTYIEPRLSRNTWEDMLGD